MRVRFLSNYAHIQCHSIPQVNTGQTFSIKNFLSLRRILSSSINLSCNDDQTIVSFYEFVLE